MSTSARRFALVLCAWLLGMLGTRTAWAHPLNPALLDVRETEGGAVVRFRVPVGGPVNAPIEPVLPDGCTPAGEPSRTVERAAQSVVTEWRLQCRGGGLVGATFGVAGLETRGTDALLRIELDDGRTFRTVLRSGEATFTVPPRAGLIQVLRAYGKLGFLHILGGSDHLAFVFGLLLLVENRRRLFWTISAFTLGHSVTLSLSALGFVHLPSRPVEVSIAVSIFVLGVELARPKDARRLGRHPWWMAGGFGLLHGLGFAGALAEVGLPAGEIPTSLFAFNLGIEAGQILFVAALLGFGWLIARIPRFPIVQRGTGLTRVPAYGIGALAVFWILERL